MGVKTGKSQIDIEKKKSIKILEHLGIHVVFKVSCAVIVTCTLLERAHIFFRSSTSMFTNIFKIQILVISSV